MGWSGTLNTSRLGCRSAAKWHDRGPKRLHEHNRISHSGSDAEYKGIPKTMLCRILWFVWSSGAVSICSDGIWKLCCVANGPVCQPALNSAVSQLVYRLFYSWGLKRPNIRQTMGRMLSLELRAKLEVKVVVVK